IAQRRRRAISDTASRGSLGRPRKHFGSFGRRRGRGLGSGGSRRRIPAASAAIRGGRRRQYAERLGGQFVRAAFAARRRRDSRKWADRFRVGRLSASRVLSPRGRRRERQVDPLGDVEIIGPKLSRAVVVEGQGCERKSEVASSGSGASGTVHWRNRAAQVSTY